MDGLLTIGRLAAEAHLSTDTIRYYESVGLIPPPSRSASGYRLYPHAEVRRLHLISQAKLLGMSLAQVKKLVDQTFTGSCTHLQRQLLDRIPTQLQEIEQRITALQQLKAELNALHDHLSGLAIHDADRVAECESCPCIDGVERRQES